MAVDPGLVLEVIDGLEGVYRWKASISESKKQVPEVGSWITIEMNRVKNSFKKVVLQKG